MIRAVRVLMARKSRRRVRCASSAICPAISTPVGPAPTTTKVSRWSTFSPRLAPSSASSKAPKIRPRSSSASSMRLHARRELGEVVVAEVGLAGAGGDDQRVVGRHGLAAEHVRGDRAGLEVDVGDLAEQHLGVVLPGQDLAGRRRDLALGEDAGRDLVEQRLEQVVGRLGDHRDVDVGRAAAPWCRTARRSRSRSRRPGAGALGAAHGSVSRRLRGVGHRLGHSLRRMSIVAWPAARRAGCRTPQGYPGAERLIRAPVWCTTRRKSWRYAVLTTESGDPS